MKRLPFAASAATLVLTSAAAHAQPENDGCDAPVSISGLYELFPFSTVGATTDGVGDALCNLFGQDQIANDVWFCWTADEGGPVSLRLCGLAAFDTKVAVYQGCGPCPSAGGILACNDDSCSLQSVVNWNASAGQQYLIRLGSYPGTAQSGDGSFTIESGVLFGPVVNPANGHSYVLLQPSSWTSAEAAAVAMGGHLATVRDADENEFLRAQVAGFDGVDRRLWLGLNDVAAEGVFVWTSGEDAPFRNWSAGEPNNSGGAEHYVEMFGSNGLWNDNRDTPTAVVYGVVELGGTACPADWNADGQVNSTDISAYLTQWLGNVQGGGLQADFNGDNTVNSTDISAFLTAWLQAVQGGC